MKISDSLNRLTNLNVEVQMIEKCLIFLCVKQLKLNYLASPFFKEYLFDISNSVLLLIEELLEKDRIELNLSSLVEIFELLIPSAEKKENGMVYTPEEIKNYIIESTITTKRAPTICDPACGCGSFLISAARYLHTKYNMLYKDIYRDKIFGVDIIPHNVERVKVLLNLLALIDGEIGEFTINVIAGNSFNFNWDKAFVKSKFDVVLGNPPYVRSRNINDEVKKTLIKWKTAQVGNTDLYIPFFELGLELLTEKGKLGFISVNTYMKSLNGRQLRKLFKENKYEMKVIDFKETQIFKGVTSYTCITIIDKGIKNNLIKYQVFTSEVELSQLSMGFDEHNRQFFDETGKKPWRLGGKEELEIVKKLESIGQPLGKYSIKNGLATLKNDIYFFHPIQEDDQYYYRQYEGKEYKIEKAICMDVAKPNVMKDENDLVRLLEKGIFPYELNSTSQFSIIQEDIIEQKFPETYKYLIAVRHILEKRDKGKGKYVSWYAYGRTQGMVFGKKLLFPYISDRPVAVLSLQEDLLFYCGYALFVDDIKELMFLKVILESSIFWYYLKRTSKPYEKGYFSTAKNYLINFCIPNFTEVEKVNLVRNQSKEEIDRILCNKYGISYEVIIRDL